MSNKPIKTASKHARPNAQPPQFNPPIPGVMAPLIPNYAIASPTNAMRPMRGLCRALIYASRSVCPFRENPAYYPLSRLCRGLYTAHLAGFRRSGHKLCCVRS